ncbi:unknown [Clostridium sp. CAG:138]|nr:unknown [Clostridium sp. CAG:138]
MRAVITACICMTYIRIAGIIVKCERKLCAVVQRCAGQSAVIAFLRAEIVAVEHALNSCRIEMRILRCGCKIRVINFDSGVNNRDRLSLSGVAQGPHVIRVYEAHGSAELCGVSVGLCVLGKLIFGCAITILNAVELFNLFNETILSAERKTVEQKRVVIGNFEISALNELLVDCRKKLVLLCSKRF